MRRDIRMKIDGRNMRALMQIEHAELVLRIGIAAVNAVAEDRHIGQRRRAVGFRHDQQFMHGTLEAVDNDFGCVGLRVEEQNFRAHLVDGD